VFILDIVLLMWLACSSSGIIVVANRCPCRKLIKRIAEWSPVSTVPGGGLFLVSVWMTGMEMLAV
jgi:hypothetical protein